MKAINITEVFCEVLSGVAVLCVIIPILAISDTIPLQKIWPLIHGHLSNTNAVVTIGFCYILGLVMNGIGLAFGELCLDELTQKFIDASPGKKEDFWRNVEPHVLQARNTNWEYYSAFRNLFILLIPGTVLWSWSICRTANIMCGLMVIIVAIPIEFALFWTMRTLMRIHCEIEQNVPAASGAS